MQIDTVILDNTPSSTGWFAGAFDSSQRHSGHNRLDESGCDKKTSSLEL